MSALILWFASGILSAAFARWAWRLLFRDPVTLSSYAGFALMVVIPPAGIVLGLVCLFFWAFGDWDDLDIIAVRWPAWWEHARYRQHRFARWLWYLGSPPCKESRFSGWRNYRPKG